MKKSLRHFFIASLLAVFSHSLFGLTSEKASLKTDTETLVFDLEITETPQERQRGLMERDKMPEKSGMAFLYTLKTRPPVIMMWMKNTPLSLDMLFLDKSGRILYIAEKTTPYSLDLIAPPLSIQPKITAVVELIGGTAKKYNIRPGHTLSFPSLSQCI